MLAHVAPPPDETNKHTEVQVVNKPFQIVEFKTESSALAHANKYGGTVFKEQGKDLWRVMDIPQGFSGQINLTMSED